MTKEDITNIIRDYLINKNIKKAALFGSFVREDFTLKSDIDILIERFPEMTLVDIIQMEYDLKKKIKRKIDLVEFDGIKSTLRKSIFEDAIYII